MRIAALCLAALAVVAPAGTVWGGLIFNGDFELGNVGFTSMYTYSIDDVSQTRTYVIGIDPHRYFSRAASYGDHSSGFGKMFIANGADQNDVFIWQQTATVTPNTNYVFCYWLSNWTDNDIRLAEIICYINGTRVGMGFAPAAVGQWMFVFHRWNSGSNTTATIQLINRDRAEVSNDFAIDDIDLFDIGDNNLLVAYSMAGGSVVTPGEGYFIYPPGEEATLEAKCESGYEFAGWGGNFSDPGHVMWTSMTSDHTAIAQFKKLDYNVNIQASGSAPNAFTTCDESADRLATFDGALESLYSSGLVVGQRKGVCSATYLFPIIKTRAGVRDITKIVVNVYGTALAGTAAVKVADSGYYKPFQGDLHQTFTGKAIPDLLRDSEGPVYWLPVEVAAVTQAWDVAGVYVSYDCASVPRSLLRRFHDQLSIYQALDAYASAPDIRDLFNLRANRKSTWEATVQTCALAQDLGGYSDTLPNAIGVCIEGLDGLLARRQSLGDFPDLAILDTYGSEQIVTCLDRTVASGQSYIAAYAGAIADGHVLRDEASQLNRSAADWKADLVTLNQTMSDVFRTLGEVYRITSNPLLCDAIERMIRAMTPWRTGEPDDLAVWIPLEPTYLDQVIQSLTDFPPEDVYVPSEF